MRATTVRRSRSAVAAGLALVLVVVLAAGCSHTSPMSTPVYEVTGFSGCKDLDLRDGGNIDRVTESCVQYEYDGLGMLVLTHVDGAFNCGASEVGGRIEFSSGGLIEIEEWEDVPVPANCICLFDVGYRITSLLPGTYHVTIAEPYLNPTNEPFDFILDLSEQCSGEVCVPRSGYPWDYDVLDREPN
jgi:hypothetical protein